MRRDRMLEARHDLRRLPLERNSRPRIGGNRAANVDFGGRGGQSFVLRYRSRSSLKTNSTLNRFHPDMPGTKSSTPDRESNQDRGHNRQEDIRKVAKILRGGNYSHGPVTSSKRPGGKSGSLRRTALGRARLSGFPPRSRRIF